MDPSLMLFSIIPSCSFAAAACLPAISLFDQLSNSPTISLSGAWHGRFFEGLAGPYGLVHSLATLYGEVHSFRGRIQNVMDTYGQHVPE
jgi:hypothetical protein